MRNQGKITKWKDDRGFGFIAPDNGGADIFLHEDSFLRRSRPPVIGEIVTFEVVSTPDGKVRAQRVLFQGEIDPRKIAMRVDIIFVSLALLFIFGISSLVYFESLPLSILFIYLLASLITFIKYYFDKSASKSDKRRTPENRLHILSLIGGWPGALIAQRLLHHKSRKISFQKKYWATVFINIIFLVLLLHPVGTVFLKELTPSHPINYKKFIADNITDLIHTKKLNQDLKSAGLDKYKGAVYSWTNKDGKRTFSNVGFPKDQAYTDGKIEWQ